jgi:hypothetical protein
MESVMNFNHFPTYEEHDPNVPVWCLTPNHSGCIHRFFDTSPISPSGRYLAVFQLRFEDHLPYPGDTGRVIVIDLETGNEVHTIDTAGWEPQMGANLNWGATDHQLYFNDVDPQNWMPFAWKLDAVTGEKTKMEGTVYHASQDGKWLVSANMSNMGRTQPGYGVVIPHECAQRNIGLSETDGFCLTNTKTGKIHRFFSIKELWERADPPIKELHPEQYEIYGFHSKFNPQCDRLMVSLRWFPAHSEPRWNLFGVNHAEVKFAWITLRVDGSEVHCAVGPEEWEKGGHHGTWLPDGEHISMNLNIDRNGLRFVQVNQDGTGLRKMLSAVMGSGHPSVHPNGTHLITDTYTYEKGTSYGDGTIPLRWVDLRNGEVIDIVRIKTETPAKESVLRVDPHPAWDRSWRYVIFNGFVDGTRRVFVADLASLLKNE